MAPKNQALARQPTKEEQKREESSEEEENSEEESGETEEGSSEEEEEEEENEVTTKPFKPQALIPKSDLKSNSKPKSKSTSRVSDSEAESDGSPSDYKMQPIVKPTASPAKRTHQEREESQELSRSSKKAKTGEKEKEEKKTSGSTPGGLIARLWSDEDEIAVLNGVIDFRKAKGHDYNSEEIYNFMKGKLQGDFNKVQLRTKLNRMKKRFLNALKKSPDPVFSKPHDDLSFELSKKIWGDDAAAANGSVSGKNGNGNGNAKKDAAKNGNVKKEIVNAEIEEKVKRENDDDEEEGEFWSKYPYLSSSFLNMRGINPSLSISEASVNLLKEKVSLIGDSKANELNQKWRQLFREELELNNKMLALMKEQTQLGLNQMNDS